MRFYFDIAFFFFFPISKSPVLSCLVWSFLIVSCCLFIFLFPFFIMWTFYNSVLSLCLIIPLSDVPVGSSLLFCSCCLSEVAFLHVCCGDLWLWARVYMRLISGTLHGCSRACFLQTGRILLRIGSLLIWDHFNFRVGHWLNVGIHGVVFPCCRWQCWHRHWPQGNPIFVWLLNAHSWGFSF